MMSPDQPSTAQISPLASALMYSDEWNLRMFGRTFLKCSTAALMSSDFVEVGSSPR